MSLSEHSIAGIRFQPGKRTTSALEVGFTIAGRIEIPIIIVAGEKSGPKLCVVAGSHACEISSVEAAIRITNMVRPERLSGTLISLPVLNSPGLQTRTPYFCPLDGQNINRVFPGNAEGSASQRIAYKAFSVVRESNYLIDLHGGDTPEEHVDIVYAPDQGEQVALAASKMLTERFEANYAEIHGVAGSVSTEACKVGIPSLVVEGGELGRFDEKTIDFLTSGILNVMKYLKMLPGESKSRRPLLLGERVWVRAPASGILIRSKRAGDKVAKGDHLGRIHDFYGSEVCSLDSPTNGVIMMSYPLPAVNVGDAMWVICKT
jgi:predicted deacylase